jgi:hypothetical protein
MAVCLCLSNKITGKESVMKVIARDRDYRKDPYIYDIYEVDISELTLLIMGLEAKIKDLSETNKTFIAYGLRSENINVTKSIEEYTALLNKLKEG